MKITMIGTGYVGLISGICFSDFGHEVVCVDKAEEKIAMLERGEVPTLPARDIGEIGDLSPGRRCLHR